MVEIELMIFWRFNFSNAGIVHHSMLLDGPLGIDLDTNLFFLSGLNWEKFHFTRSVNSGRSPQKSFFACFSQKKFLFTVDGYGEVKYHPQSPGREIYPQILLKTQKITPASKNNFSTSHLLSFPVSQLPSYPCFHKKNYSRNEKQLLNFPASHLLSFIASLF